MIELDSAPLPPSRKPKAQPRCGTCGAIIEGDAWTGTRCKCSHPASVETGWTTGAVVKRYPTEGSVLLIGGAFNGQERDMRPYNGARFVALPLDDGCVEWYERGDVSGYFWLASVSPAGIELRGFPQ